MYTIKPVDFIANQGLITSDNLGTDSTTEWTSAAVSVGDLRKVTTTSNGASFASYKIYQAITTTGTTDPTVDVGSVSVGVGTDWKEVSSVNEWAWANEVLADQTTGAGTTIEIQVLPGQVVNAIGFANVDANEIQVVITDPTEGIVYAETFDLTSYVGIDSFYDWLFEPIIENRKLTLFSLPPYIDATIDITVSVPSGNPKIGSIIMGQEFIVGTSLYGTNFSFEDYSAVTYVPELGRTIVTERDYSEETRAVIFIEDVRLEAVRDLIASQRNKLTAWTADKNDSGTTVFGLLREFTVTMRDHNGTFVDLEIGGST